MNHSEATSAAQLLHAIRQLVSNQAWKELVEPMLEETHERHLLGISDRNKSAEERSSHVEAYHLARDMEALIPDKVKSLESQLGAWMTENDQVDSRIADVLSNEGWRN